MKQYNRPDAELIIICTNDIMTASMIKNVGTVTFFSSGFEVDPGYED